MGDVYLEKVRGHLYVSLDKWRTFRGSLLCASVCVCFVLMILCGFHIIKSTSIWLLVDLTTSPWRGRFGTRGSLFPGTTIYHHLMDGYPPRWKMETAQQGLITLSLCFLGLSQQNELVPRWTRAEAEGEWQLMSVCGSWRGIRGRNPEEPGSRAVSLGHEVRPLETWLTCVIFPVVSVSITHWNTSKCLWEVELKGELILQQKILKSLHKFFLICTFHELFEVSLLIHMWLQYFKWSKGTLSYFPIPNLSCFYLCDYCNLIFVSFIRYDLWNSWKTVSWKISILEKNIS